MNPDFCQKVSVTEKKIMVELAPEPSFTYQNTDALCYGSSISFTNTSNVLSADCQDYSFKWEVNSESENFNISDYDFINGTDISTQDAEIIFNKAGIYNVTLSITNACGVVKSAAATIEILGDPEVSFKSDFVSACDGYPANYTIDFNLGDYMPTYSEYPSVATNYVWSISGTDVTNADYIFTDGTTLNSQYPIITFKAYKTYTIQVTASGSCFNSSTATFDFELKQEPNITNTAVTQTLCSGALSQEIVLQSSIPNVTTFTWETTATNGISGFIPSGSGTSIPATLLVNTTNETGSVTYTVTPMHNGCVGSTAVFEIYVAPVAFIPDQLINVCSGDTFDLELSHNPPDLLLTNNTLFTWVANSTFGISGITNQNVPSNKVTQNLINETNGPIDVLYEVTAYSGDATNTCSYTFNMTVTVYPKPKINDMNITVCSDQFFEISPENNLPSEIVPSNTLYTWNTSLITGITGQTNQNTPTSSISQTLVNVTNSPLDVIYTVQALAEADGTACSDIFTIIVTVNPSPIADISGNIELCQYSTEPEITFSATNGLPPYTFTYSINDGPDLFITTTETNTSIKLQIPTNDLAVFKYCLKEVKDASIENCPRSYDSSCVEVTINSSPLPTTQPVSYQNACLGATITPLKVEYTGGTSTANYQWYSNTTNSNNGGVVIDGATSSTYTPDPFTTIGSYFYYAIITFDSATCNTIISDIAEVHVIDNPIVSKQPLREQTLCVNTLPNNLEITASGGLGNFSYQWFINTTNTNSNGTKLQGATLPNFTPPTNVIGTFYYYCEVSQPYAGCSDVSEIAEVNVVEIPTITAQPISNTICKNDMDFELSVEFINGTSNPSYQWYSNQINSNSGGLLIPNETQPNFKPKTSTPGTTYYYCVLNFNEGDCGTIISNTAEITVNDIPSIKNIERLVCSKTLIEYDPTSDIENTLPINTKYSWSLKSMSPENSVTGVTNETNMDYFSQLLTNTSKELSTVTYTVVPQIDSCYGSEFTITIKVLPSPDVIFTEDNQTICNNDNTSLVTLNTTTSGTISFDWSAKIPTGLLGATENGQNTIPVQKLINTTNTPLTIVYEVTATLIDELLCNGNPVNYYITVNPEFTSSGITSNYNGYGVSKFAGSDGFINLTTIGGSENYTYKWTGPNNFSSTEKNISNLVSGSYIVSIEDGYCSPIILSFNLTEPSELLIEEDLTNHTNIACYGDNDGNINVLIKQESIRPYHYTLYDNMGTVIKSVVNTNSTSQIFSGLSAGTYTLQIMDGNNAFKLLENIQITQPNELTITPNITPLTCNGKQDAAIFLNIVGGIPPYEVLWSNLGDGPFQDNLGVGIYNAKITDANNCEKYISVNISEVKDFDIDAVIQHVTCFGANDGSINLNLKGDASSLKLRWSDGSNSGLVRNNLAPGNYTATVTNASNCSLSKTFIINEPLPLTVSADIIDATDCNLTNSGSIDLKISGGYPPYKTLWSNNSTSEDLININPGNYTVYITDANNCNHTATYKVLRPEPLTLDVTSSIRTNCQTWNFSEDFIAKISGGMPPYNLNWSTGNITGANNEFMSTSQEGLIRLIATDALGCSISYSEIVNLPSFQVLAFDQQSYSLDTFGTYSIKDTINFTTLTTGDYINIIWEFGDGTFSNDLNPSHTYLKPGTYEVTQTITFSYGCTYSLKKHLTIENGYKLMIPSAFTPNSDGINDIFFPKQEGLKNIYLSIYNTWGGLIYQEHGNSVKGWNGFINNLPAENGNYYYVFEGTTFYGEVIKKSDVFTLIK